MLKRRPCRLCWLSVIFIYLNLNFSCSSGCGLSAAIGPWLLTLYFSVRWQRNFNWPIECPNFNGFWMKSDIWQRNAFGCVVPKGCLHWIQGMPSQTDQQKQIPCRFFIGWSLDCVFIKTTSQRLLQYIRHLNNTSDPVAFKAVRTWESRTISDHCFYYQYLLLFYMKLAEN